MKNQVQREQKLLRLTRCMYVDVYAKPGPIQCRNYITHATILHDWRDELIAGCEEHILSLLNRSQVFKKFRNLEQIKDIKLPELEDD